MLLFIKEPIDLKDKALNSMQHAVWVCRLYPQSLYDSLSEARKSTLVKLSPISRLVDTINSDNTTDNMRPNKVGTRSEAKPNHVLKTQPREEKTIQPRVGERKQNRTIQMQQ